MNKDKVIKTSLSPRLHFGRIGGIFALLSILCFPFLLITLAGLRINPLFVIGDTLQLLSLLFVPWVFITTLLPIKFTRRSFDPFFLSLGLYGAPMLVFLWFCRLPFYFVKGMQMWWLDWLRALLSELSAWPYIIVISGFSFPLLFLAIFLHKRIDRIYESCWIYGIFFLLPVFYLLFGSIALLA